MPEEARPALAEVIGLYWKRAFKLPKWDLRRRIKRSLRRRGFEFLGLERGDGALYLAARFRGRVIALRITPD
ncbi:MAG TPA: hypothetical protein ENJ40_00105 [Thermosulfurimonas dismutans]|uniref:Uncharacterized protein n=1 Tax=Thermosulfurimonas dismutans TaxID=999894 RepID=A0A7C3GZP8_9BACT|nr:hypothetical protein [Thermosulfurimonas dismutans]